MTLRSEFYDFYRNTAWIIVYSIVQGCFNHQPYAARPISQAWVKIGRLTAGSKLLRLGGAAGEALGGQFCLAFEISYEGVTEGPYITPIEGY